RRAGSSRRRRPASSPPPPRAPARAEAGPSAGGPRGSGLEGLLRRRARARSAPLLADVVLVLVAELRHGAERGGDRGVPERADRLAGDRVADLGQQVEVVLV